MAARILDPRKLLMLTLIFLPLLVLFLWPFLAHGQEVAAVALDPENLELFLGQLVAAIQGGEWMAVAILVGIGLVWAIRKWGVRLWPALGSKRAGAITALLAGILPIFGMALLSGTPITLKLGVNALITGLGMIGGWVGLRRIIWNDVEKGVVKEAAEKVVPVPGTASLEELRQELDGR